MSRSSSSSPPPAAAWDLRFAKAVRSKANWHIKLLDDSRDLREKWALEAGLVEKGAEQAKVDALIRELKREATRIRYLDPVLPKELPLSADTADWAAIDVAVSAARTRVRDYKYAVPP
ncbi:hypothetical protein CALVIDRAFT_596665 [Calocera viscosa TUFC12733]|uniref:Uncharacterized protein n=1 Tax=Calocera viscosa (strain TUFC12733) TaxID=1330018 RepID=A0A167P9K1_CALVF|nr:hypothetical protein CALVIDRAFT_596665 [Calocera viscosa TUFC12733]